jgi:hypothetical protein
MKPRLVDDSAGRAEEEVRLGRRGDEKFDVAVSSGENIGILEGIGETEDDGEESLCDEVGSCRWLGVSRTWACGMCSESGTCSVLYDDIC